MTYRTGSIRKIHVIGLDNDEDMLAQLEAFSSQAGIRHAAILSGFGSTKAYHSHVVRSTKLPPGYSTDGSTPTSSTRIDTYRTGATWSRARLDSPVR